MVIADVSVQGDHDVWAQRWFSSRWFRFKSLLVDEWRAYTNLLSHNAIRLHDEDDDLVWSWNKINGVLLVMLACKALSINLEGETFKWWWWYLFWKCNVLWKLRYLLGWIWHPNFNLGQLSEARLARAKYVFFVQDGRRISWLLACFLFFHFIGLARYLPKYELFWNLVPFRSWAILVALVLKSELKFIHNTTMLWFLGSLVAQESGFIWRVCWESWTCGAQYLCSF